MDNNVSAIFEGLNSEQRKAVACIDGPVLIVAGAGSGKTRVLTSRVAHMLENGCEPDRILALTFTKKAAAEMKERIALMVGERKARRVWMGTFHSIFIRFLREYADRIGYPESFTIYDQSDSISAVKACVKELQLDDKIYKPKEVLSRISMAKNNLVTAAAYRNNPTILTNDSHAKKSRLCDVYSLYAQKCKAAGVMDFDDILLNMNILLRDCPEALESISGRFSYILVDEYQDTNYAQYLILRKLSQGHRNICVVGDDSQSIYAFRGAKIENILNFKKDYPECNVFRLERNYRSTRTIVEAANSLIAKNENRIPKECYAVGETGDRIRLLRAFSEQEEAVLITSGILERMREDRAEYQDFAILYRTNSQSRALEEALRKRNLPYVIYSGNSFFERAEVKDMMAYFKLLANVNDDESFKRVVNKPARGIGDTSLNALAQVARTKGISYFRAVWDEGLVSEGLRPAAIAKLQSFGNMINSLAAMLPSTDAHQLALKVADLSGLYAFFKSDTSIEGQSRTSNVEELLNSVAAFVEDRQNEILAEAEAEGASETEQLPLVTLDAFLENISLLSNVDQESEEDTNNKIALMTVHSAKGLEFPYVFVAGMEENLFPSGGMMASPSDIEEERRLFYVALTRAKKAVVLSFAGTRMRNGQHESNSPSRFLREIDSKYIQNPLRSEDFEDSDAEDDEPGFRFGSGSRSGYYGRSGAVTRQPSGGSARGGYGSSAGYGRYGSASGGGGRSGSSSGAASHAGSASHTGSAGPSGYGRQVGQPSAGTLPRQGVPAAPEERYRDFVPAPMDSFSIGQRIEHNRFGPGMILDLTGAAPDIKAKIAFDDYPEPKTILLKYAKMRPEKL